MKDYLTGQCERVTKSSQPMTSQEIEKLLSRFENWELTNIEDTPRLRRVFEFKNFTDGVTFAQEIAKVADQQDHHPQILLDYNQVRVDWWTHVLDALHQNDFIMAAKTDDIYSRFALITGDRDRVDEALDETFPASDPTSY